MTDVTSPAYIGGQLTASELAALDTATNAEAVEGIAFAAAAAARAAQSAISAATAAPAAPATPAGPSDGTIQPAPAADTPILGKFKTQADLEKAYTELEQRLSKAGAQKQAEP